MNTPKVAYLPDDRATSLQLTPESVNDGWQMQRIRNAFVFTSNDCTIILHISEYENGDGVIEGSASGNAPYCKIYKCSVDCTQNYILAFNATLILLYGQVNMWGEE